MVSLISFRCRLTIGLKEGHIIRENFLYAIQTGCRFTLIEVIGYIFTLIRYR